MEINVRKDQIFERSADERGRISLPSSEFSDKTLTVAVLDVED